MKQLLNRKVFKAIPVWGVLALATVGVVAAAWVLQTRTTGILLGAKAKHLEISVNSPDFNTWELSTAGFWSDVAYDTDIPGDKDYDETFKLKTSKDLTNVSIKIENIERKDNQGNVVERPVEATDDILNWYYAYNNTGVTDDIGTLRDLEVNATGYVMAFTDADTDKISDEVYNLKVNFLASQIQAVESLNGANVSFDLVFEEATP